MGLPEPGDRRVIGALIGRDHPKGHIPLAQPLNPSTRPFSQAIRIQQQRHHHGRLVRRRSPAIRSIGPGHGRQIHLGYRVQDEPGQIAFRQPVLQCRGQQIELRSLTGEKVIAHRVTLQEVLGAYDT